MGSIVETNDGLSEDYLLDVMSDQNSLILRLNHLFDIELNHKLIEALIAIHFKHSDIYVKYISLNVLINNILKDNQKLDTIWSHNGWHCLPQMSQFLNRLMTKVSVESCIGFQSVVTKFVDNLSQLSEPNSQLCEDHCLCSTPEAVVNIFSQLNDKNLNNISMVFIKLMKNSKNRCFVKNCLNLLTIIVKQNDNNFVSMKSISEFIFDDNFFNEIKIEDNVYAFGGIYSPESPEEDIEYDCDVVVMRQWIHLFLITLSSDFVMNSTSEEVLRNQLKSCSQYVRHKSKRFDGNDWIIKLFIEEDEQLLSGLYCLVRIGIRLSDNQLSHYVMNAFIESIDCDSSVLLDMLCNDSQTATLLLKLLLIYLKLSDITIGIEVNVKNVLLDLNAKTLRLSAKQLFPYNVKPLTKLLNKLLITA